MNNSLYIFQITCSYGNALTCQHFDSIDESVFNDSANYLTDLR